MTRMSPLITCPTLPVCSPCSCCYRACDILVCVHVYTASCQWSYYTLSKSTIPKFCVHHTVIHSLAVVGYVCGVLWLGTNHTQDGSLCAGADSERRCVCPCSTLRPPLSPACLSSGDSSLYLGFGSRLHSDCFSSAGFSAASVHT